MQTYKCDFGQGLNATILAPETFPHNPQQIGKVKWNQSLNRERVVEIFPRYKDWVIDSYRSICDEWGCSLCYAFTLSEGGVECWAFRPYEAPRKMNTPPIP
jgi:hypothetical protein